MYIHRYYYKYALLNKIKKYNKYHTHYKIKIILILTIHYFG